MKPVRHDARTGAREGAISRAAKLYSETQNLSQSLTAAYESGYESGHLSQSRDTWTPVEQELPKEPGIYLTTCFGGGKWLVDTAHFDHLGWHLPHKELIQAWMPIPPYEQEK
jgi:hypothetical protein